MGGGQPPHTPLSSSQSFDATVKQSKEQARFEGPEAESSLWGLWNEQNENVESKSEDQMTSQDNKSISTSMWRDERVPVFSTSMWRDERVEVTERFSGWFDRMLKYGFEENVDFTSVKSFTVVIIIMYVYILVFITHYLVQI